MQKILQLDLKGGDELSYAVDIRHDAVQVSYFPYAYLSIECILKLSKWKDIILNQYFNMYDDM